MHVQWPEELRRQPAQAVERQCRQQAGSDPRVGSATSRSTGAAGSGHSILGEPNQHAGPAGRPRDDPTPTGPIGSARNGSFGAVTGDRSAAATSRVSRQRSASRWSRSSGMSSDVHADVIGLRPRDRRAIASAGCARAPGGGRGSLTVCRSLPCRECPLTVPSGVSKLANFRVTRTLRIVTVASRFAGYNSSVKEVVDCALKEGVQCTSVSSRPLWHVQYFNFGSGARPRALPRNTSPAARTYVRLGGSRSPSILLSMVAAHARAWAWFTDSQAGWRPTTA